MAATAVRTECSTTVKRADEGFSGVATLIHSGTGFSAPTIFERKDVSNLPESNDRVTQPIYAMCLPKRADAARWQAF
jgi:hypothetical protein